MAPAIGTEDWAPRALSADRCLLLPCALPDVGETLDAVPAIAYFATDEALCWCPWPCGEAESSASEARPWPCGVADASEERQRAAHQRVIAEHSSRECLGYASWVSDGAASCGAGSRLLVREMTAHTGTRIWEASWLHRRWAVENPACFPRSARVLELGAGCGLLGLAVAATHGVEVTLSDFRGHHELTDSSVVSNLLHNARENRDVVGARGGSVRVIDLDWERPDQPHLCRAADEPRPDAAAPPCTGADGCHREACGVEAADVVVATEVLYTEAGAAAFVRTLARWMARPHGVCYLLNNQRRTGVARLEAECDAHGLRVGRMPTLEGDACGATSTFAPPWDESDLYVFLRLTWASA